MTDAFAALLAPRSVRVLPGRTRRSAITAGRGCRIRSNGAVDVAVLTGAAGIPADAAAALLLQGARLRRRAGAAPDALVLGPGAGLWSPHLRAGISGAGTPRRDGWLLLSQGCGIAEQALRAAAARDLPIAAAVATGAAGPSLLRLARLGVECGPARRLLVALHRPCPFAELLAFGLQRPNAVLLITDSAEPLGQVPGPVEATRPSTSQLARSLGLPVVRSVEQLAAAATLLDAGLPRDKRRILGIAPHTDEAVLLADALGRAGLRHGGTPAAAVVRDGAPASKRSLRAVDAAVVVKASGEAPRILLGGRGRTVGADAETLRALQALLDPAVVPAPQSSGRRSETARQAALMLDRWPAELTEVEVKRLLALYRLRSPDEKLVTSASAAAKAAAELGGPVTVKAVGPGLSRRADRGALRLDVDGGAAVRQAFRDVLVACAAMRPSPPLVGVLISRMVALPFALEVSLLWPAGAPPVLVACKRREGDEVVALPCPLGAAQAAWAASRLLGATSSGSRDHTADWLRRLSIIALDLSGRLRWLRIDTLAPPSKTDPPLVLDAAALQTASLRDPLGLRGGEPIE